MPEAHRRYARGLRRRRLDGNNCPATQSQQMRGFHAEVVHHGEQIFRLCRDVETQRVKVTRFFEKSATFPGDDEGFFPKKSIQRSQSLAGMPQAETRMMALSDRCPDE